MSRQKRSDIVEMKAIRRADGGVSYIPQRQQQDDAFELAELDPVQLAQSQQAAQPVIENLTGGYKDRAIGFSIKTWQIAILAGVGMWLLARVGAGVPLFSIRAVLSLLAGAGAVWLVAFALDLLLSPAGVAWYNSRRLWNHLDREQAERHRHYRRRNHDN